MLSTWNAWNDPIWNELDRTLAALGRRPVARRNGPAARTRSRQGLWARRTEDGAAYLVSLDLPGVRADGLDLELEGRSVRLTAQRADGRGAYEHAFTLPADAEVAGAAADLSDGVLTLTVPRRSEDQPRKIAITVAGELPPAQADEPEADATDEDAP